MPLESLNLNDYYNKNSLIIPAFCVILCLKVMRTMKVGKAVLAIYKAFELTSSTPKNNQNRILYFQEIRNIFFVVVRTSHIRYLFNVEISVTI